VINILSLGAGVQSSALLLMAYHGEIERPDHAIFADTGWEPQEVYTWLDKLENIVDIPVHRTSVGRRIQDDELRAKMRGHIADETLNRYITMPFYTRDKHGNVGMVQRQCTNEYKIQPLHKKIRELMGLKPRQWAPKTPEVELWFGISSDEASRMRMADKLYIVNHYPLVESRTSRVDCIAWLENCGYSDVPRSACIGCPFKHPVEWRLMKDNSPEEFTEAVAFDETMRNRGGDRGDLYLFRGAIPLAEADLSTLKDHGQLSLWDGECAGMCGV